MISDTKKFGELSSLLGFLGDNKDDLSEAEFELTINKFGGYAEDREDEEPITNEMPPEIEPLMPTSAPPPPPPALTFEE